MFELNRTFRTNTGVSHFRYIHSSTITAFIVFLVFGISVLALANPFLQNFSFNSDQLTVASFVDDLLRNPHFSFLTWMYPRAPYAFPDFPIFLATRYLSGDSALSMFIHTAFHVLALCFGAKLFLDLAVTARKRSAAIFIFFSLCASSLLYGSISESGELLLWQFVPISHATAAVVSLYCFRLYVAVIRRGSILQHFAFIILCSLSILSDKIFLFYFCVPAGFALIASARRRWAFSEVGIYFIEVLTSATIAIFLDHLVISQKIDPIHFDWKNVVAVAAMVRSGPIPWAFCVFSFFASIKVCLIDTNGRRGEQADQDLVLARSFLGALVVSGTVLTLALWREPTPAFGRYAVAMTLGSMLSVAVALSELSLRSVRWIQIAFSSAILALFVDAAPKLISPTQVLKEQSEEVMTLKACRLQFGLQTGFGNYWIARRLSVLANWSPQVNQFEPGYPRPFFWGNNFIWFFEDLATGKASTVNFIVTNGLEISDIERSYGRPSREADCGPFHVFVYNDPDSLRSAILEQLSQYQIGYDQKGRIVKLSKLNVPRFTLSSMAFQTGRREGRSLLATSPRDRAGFLMFGPYVDLLPGNYTVGFKFSCEGNRSPNILDVTANSGQDVLASAVLSPGDSRCDGAVRSIELPLQITSPAARLETRAYYSGTGSFGIRDVSLSSSRN